MEQVPRLIRETHDPAGKANGTLRVVDELRSPDSRELVRDPRVAHHLAYAAGNQVELQLDLWMLAAHLLAQPGKQRINPGVQRQRLTPRAQLLFGDRALGAALAG